MDCWKEFEIVLNYFLLGLEKVVFKILRIISPFQIRILLRFVAP